MNAPKTFPRFLPYLISVVTFLAVSIACFSPVLEGRKLQMHDVVQYDGMRQDIVDHQKKYGEDPQWAGRMFSGMPAYLISVKYDSQIIRTASWALEKMASPISMIFLAMLCFWAMCLLCGINPWVGIVPSLAYGLSTYFFLIIGAGHITKMVALAYAPLMLGGIFYTFRREKWLGAGLTALFTSIEIGAGHPQISYYFAIVAAIFWVNELVVSMRDSWIRRTESGEAKDPDFGFWMKLLFVPWREKGMSRFYAATGLLALAVVLAVGSNFISLYNIQISSKYTTRGGSELKEAASAGMKQSGLDLQYATAWSYGIGESLNMLVPDLMGGSSAGGFSKDGQVAEVLKKYNARDMAPHLPAYWGDQPYTGGPTYLGAVAIFLALAGLFLLRGRYKWWVLAAAVLAIMLAWGSNMMWFTKLFFNWFPGYNKFRTVSMILVIVEWAVPFLAAMFLYKAWKGDAEPAKMRRSILGALYISGGIVLALLLFGGTLFDFTSARDTSMPGDVASVMREERISMMRGDCLRSLVFILLSAGVLWILFKGKMKRGLAIAVLAVLVCADIIPVNARFLPWSSFTSAKNTLVRPTDADLRIMADSTPGFRVANLSLDPFNDATTSYFHRSIGGYHGAKLQRYQDIIDRYLSKMDMGVYNMLDTRWFIVPSGEKGDGPPVAQFNADANGAAWLVDGVSYVTSPDQEIDALGKVDLKKEAVVDSRFKSLIPDGQEGLSGDTLSSIVLTDYRVNRLTYRYTADHPCVAVFSEIYYPDGWTATLDGKPLDYFRADYTLRGASIPAGTHQIVFSFRSPHFAALSAITLVCCLLILLWVVVAAVVTQKCCRKNDQGQ